LALPDGTQNNRRQRESLKDLAQHVVKSGPGCTAAGLAGKGAVKADRRVPGQAKRRQRNIIQCGRKVDGDRPGCRLIQRGKDGWALLKRRRGYWRNM